MIDICDFAVGPSRQLYGLTIASERPGHRMTLPLAQGVKFDVDWKYLPEASSRG
jgi:hypothetical protein